MGRNTAGKAGPKGNINQETAMPELVEQVKADFERATAWVVRYERQVEKEGATTLTAQGNRVPSAQMKNLQAVWAHKRALMKLYKDIVGAVPVEGEEPELGVVLNFEKRHKKAVGG